MPAKGRGRTAPYRGRSGASWIWSTPLDAGASEGEFRSGYALTPSRSHSKNNLSFLQKGGPRKESSQRTATALFFYPSCGDFQLSLREFHLSLISRLRCGRPQRPFDGPGVQIRANRLIGPGKCLVGTDECPPRGEVVQRPTEAAQEPRGSGPLPSTPARARGSSVRATPSLHPARILKTISLFYRKEDPEKSRLRGRLQLFFFIPRVGISNCRCGNSICR